MKKIAFTLVFLIMLFAMALFFLQHDEETAPSNTSHRDVSLKKIVEKNSDIPKEASYPLQSKTDDNAAVEEVQDLAELPRQIELGEISFPVAFEDDTVSVELKSIILEEVEIIYGHLDTNVEERYKSFKFGKLTYSKFKDIDFSGEGRFRPDAYRGFGKLISLNGTEHLVIPEQLIDAYEDAQAFRETHRSAYQELDEFVSRLNNLEHEPAHELLFVPEEMGGSKILTPDVIESWEKEYRKGSLLYFNKSEAKSAELNEPLITEIAIINEGIPQGMHDIVYIDGKGWRLFIPVL